MTEPLDNAIALEDHTLAPGEAPAMVRAGGMLAGLLHEIGQRHKTRQGGGWTGGLRCGYSIIDKDLRGLRPGTLTVLSAEPNIGKSTFANCLAYGAAAFPGQGCAVLYTTFENPPEDLLLKHLARLSGWTQDDLLDGVIPSDNPQLLAAAQKLAALPLFYQAGNSAVNPGLLKSRLDSLRVEVPGAKLLLCLDYLQFWARYSPGDNSVEKIGMALAGLTDIAKSCEASVLAIGSQNRDANKGGGAGMFGGRGSGDIEYDCDQLLIMSSQQKPGDGDSSEREIDVTVMKARFGGQGAKGKFLFKKDRAYFEELP